MPNMQRWITKGFDAFRQGTFGNGGQNLYVSRKGVLQRIHQTDTNRSGYVDLVFCNSQNHEENTPVYLYPDPVGAPEKRKEIFIRGSRCGEVTDINGDGLEDLVVGRSWDGINQQLNAAVVYGSAEGLTNRYLDFLPAAKSSAVATGDFNSDGRMDIVFISEGKLKVFYQSASGFPIGGGEVHEFPDAEELATIRDEHTGVHHLLVRTKDASCFIISGTKQGLDFQGAPRKLLDKDPDYQKIDKTNADYTQSVQETPARIQVIHLRKGRTGATNPYIFIAQKKKALLYPYADGKVGAPLAFACEHALAVAVGSMRTSGFSDLVFACRDTSIGKECSWAYFGYESGWPEKSRRALPSHNACDAALADFSGKGFQDIVICQGNTAESFTSETLIYQGSAAGPAIEPLRLLSHNAIRALVIHVGPEKKPQLVILNRHSGSRIGNADAFIYHGGPDGFSQQNRTRLPAWGATDMVCCDLQDRGWPDIVFSNAAELSPWLDPGSYIYHSGPDGFKPAPDASLPTARAHGLAVGDFNRDGFLDLVFGGFDNNTLMIFYGSEKGFRPENTVRLKMEYQGKVYKEPRFLACADLNNDGWLDLVVPIISENVCFILWGGPQGFSFERAQVLNVRHGCNAKVADLNGDGWPEIIVGGHTQSEFGPHDAFVYIYWGGPQGFSESRKTLLPTNAVNSIAVADFNRDGWLDLFVASYQDGRLRDLDSFLYWNQGDGLFLQHKVTPLRTHAVSGNCAADFNEDGWIDLAVANHKVYGDHISYSTVWHNGPGGFDEKRVTNLPSEGIHGMGNVDIGNILDRGPEEYYTSAPHELPEEAGITSFDCVADIPAKTWVKAQFRCAALQEELEKIPWRGPVGPSSWFSIGQRVDQTLFRGRWVQYRLTLGAFNSLATPRVSEVVVNLEKP